MLVHDYVSTISTLVSSYLFPRVASYLLVTTPCSPRRLVVVAIVVHVANLGLIAFGTYEPKVKEKMQEPDKATNDILLY